MDRTQPRRTDPFGPSEETYRVVLAVSLGHVVLGGIGWAVLTVTPEGSALGGAAGLLVLLLIIHGAEWAFELLNRTMLRIKTRGYDG